MDLVNPFDEVVVFGKAYPRDATFGSDVRNVRAIVPTGSHVGHANDAKHVRGPRSGGPATKLEHYTRGKVGKAANSTVGRAIVRGMAPKNDAKVTGLWAANKQKGYRRQLSMDSLRSKLNFGDAGTSGQRLTGS